MDWLTSGITVQGSKKRVRNDSQGLGLNNRKDGVASNADGEDGTKRKFGSRRSKSLFINLNFFLVISAGIPSRQLEIRGRSSEE